ncbi:MAG: M23 family metallopeptidase [Anaerolineae bacterium]
MSLADIGLFLFPDWLREWVRFVLLPSLGLSPYHIATGLFRGVLDSFLLIFFVLGIMRGSDYYMQSHYALSPEIQVKVIKWSSISDVVAKRNDIPREVPLVLWYKEAGMEAVNPSLCTGIIGAYDLVQSGERPCFTPGPISDLEVTEQLAIAGREFKKRCPEIRYETQNPELIKKCYFAYNAGVGASLSGDSDQSAYVMNGYDSAHQNMLYQDIVLGTVRVQQLGAWPVHLAMQGMTRSGPDLEEHNYDIPNQLEEPSTLSIALLDMATRLYDWMSYRFTAVMVNSSAEMQLSRSALPVGETCLANLPQDLDLALLPRLNPVVDSPVLTQDVHGCSYALPGMDISNFQLSSLLQAPMPGQISTFTDQWHNTTIRIENDEWIVLMLHPRSYLVSEGQVVRGQAVGVMGAVGNATGPHVHYSVFSKVANSFVDPAELLP